MLAQDGIIRISQIEISGNRLCFGKSGRENLELAEQASDRIAVVAVVVVCWVGVAIHIEVRVVGIVVIVRNGGPEVAVVPNIPEITVEVAGGSEVKSLTVLKESFDLGLFLEINDGTVGDLLCCDLTRQVDSLPFLL